MREGTITTKTKVNDNEDTILLAVDTALFSPDELVSHGINNEVIDVLENEDAVGNDAKEGNVTCIDCKGESPKKDPTKIIIKKVNSMMHAFGIRHGDVFDIIKILKNKDVAYKYVIYYPKTKTTIGFPDFYVETSD